MPTRTPYVLSPLRLRARSSRLEIVVFQYATSFIAAEALSDRCYPATRPLRSATRRSSAPAAPRYPIDLLKNAGVDMTTDEPLALTMKEMNRVMDEMEAILVRRGK